MEVCHGFGGVIDLAENITRAFKDPTLFQKFEDSDGLYASSTDLPFPIEKELIDFNQISDVNWDAVEYVMKTADVNIHAGEKDSFGWLTGVIEPNKKPEWANGNYVCIIYG